MPNTRRTVILLAAMLTALMLSSPTAFAALRLGTDNAETLTGTHSADLIIGKGGNDVLKGLAANDVYYFADNFGNDTLEELAKYKVGKKKLPGGSDTLNFSNVTTSVLAYLIPQWSSYGYNFGADNISQVRLGSSVVENVTGGANSDALYGGGFTNTLKPGGGATNWLYDYGGNNGSIVGNVGLPDLPASSDTYKGFGAAPSGANTQVYDWGGTADKLVFPGESSDYYVDAVNLDGNATTNESLQVFNPTNNSGVYVVGHFGEFGNLTSLHSQHGQIEQLVFADGTFSTAGMQAQSLQIQSLESSSTTTSASVAEEAQKQAEQARSDTATTLPVPAE